MGGISSFQIVKKWDFPKFWREEKCGRELSEFPSTHFNSLFQLAQKAAGLPKSAFRQAIQRWLGVGVAGAEKMRSSTSPFSSPWGRPGPCSFTVTPPLQNSLTPQHMRAGRKHFLGIFGRCRNFPLTGRIYCGIVDKHLRPMPVCRSGGIGRRPGLKILCSKRTCRFDPGLRHHIIFPQKLRTAFAGAPIQVFISRGRAVGSSSGS